MASNYLVQAIFSHDSALPEDVSINTWSCRTAATDDLTALTDFVENLDAFYLAVDAYLSSTLNGDLLYKCFNRADATPRQPVLSIATAVNVGATTIPAEVAICMSFQGVAVSGQSQARRRGRIFLGPLVHSANDTNTGRPTSTVRTAIATAADTLVTESKSNADWDWQVWSQINGSGVSVDNGWIDDAFDTQRRRGLRPTVRSTFS